MAKRIQKEPVQKWKRYLDSIDGTSGKLSKNFTYQLNEHVSDRVSNLATAHLILNLGSKTAHIIIPSDSNNFGDHGLDQESAIRAAKMRLLLHDNLVKEIKHEVKDQGDWQIQVHDYIAQEHFDQLGLPHVALFAHYAERVAELKQLVLK